MFSLKKAALAATLLLAPLGVAAGQEAGTVDAGLFGRFSLLDDAVSADAGLSLGGRLGVFVKRNLALELEYATGGTPSPKTVTSPTHLRLAMHRPLENNWSMIYGGGLVFDRYRVPTAVELKNNYAVHGLFGVQRAFNARTAARADIIADIGSNVNFHLQAGLNFRFAPPPPPPPPVVDSDRDGVPDDADACPNTPADEYVDGRGCVPPKDSDNDGVFDPNDRCPNTPEGVTVDGTGCQPDTDRDGVYDVNDRCPNTPAGVRVNAEGCPLDTDGDGVNNDMDRCPNTPAGVQVDATGCAPDADRDGVPDAVDACPNTRAGVRLDARGCEVIFEEGTTNIVLEGVTFNTGSAVLTSASNAVLDRVAQALLNNPTVRVEVQGHTDNTGSVAGNNRISTARANSVRTYLIRRGVPAARLTARGYGPSQPKADNSTPAGRAQNRRVELKKID